MQTLSNIELSTDSDAASYIKDEVVEVIFAAHDGEVISREGPNRYRAGDAIVTGSTGDRWSVSRDRFDTKYLPVTAIMNGQDGPHRARPIPVLAKQMPVSFVVARSAGGDMLRGNAQDWLLQYAPGDYGVVEDARFRRVYRRIGN